MDRDQYPEWARRAINWGAEYLDTIRQRPVRSRVEPGESIRELPASPPKRPEPMEEIWADFERIVPGRLTNWQHPRFFAYFPSNASPASMVAEHLTTAMAVNPMIWQTSPVATELEARMIDWLRQALGLGDHFTGVTHDTASMATFSAVLSMRERATGWDSNAHGLGNHRLRIYASAQTHSSVDKAVVMAGIGRENLVKVPTDARWAMRPEALEAAIKADIAAGLTPAGVVLCVGGTGIGASDPISAAIAVAKAHDLPVHVDAAWAGSAMICPEQRQHWEGIDGADSIVFNPHKWLGVQFDCSVQFLADPTDQIRTLAMRPDYLHTPGQDQITNFSEWTPQLGRRFRALKLWFVLRAYGLDGLRERIANHIRWTADLAALIDQSADFELVTPPMFALFTFRYLREGAEPDSLNQRLIEAINRDGRIYLTQTVHEGRFVIRFTVGQWDTTEEDVSAAWQVIREIAESLD
ncbi:aspartate aminotransferase family protein [Rhodobacteraceae bacterium NNCM2]|nr:aspartate aminotransferase family protein [Coraliihabitans acroporae]